MSDGFASTFPSPLGLDLRGAALPGLPQGAAAPQPVERSAPTPILSAAQARLRNAALARRRPVAIRIGNRAVQLALQPAAPGPGDAPWLSLSLDGAEVAVALPWSLIRRIAGRPLEAATPEDAALLVEDALTDWLDAAEDALALPLRFARIDRAAPDLAEPVLLSLAIDLAGPQPARHRLRLALSAPAADALTRALSRWDRPRGALPGLVLRARVEIDGAPITLEELQSLAPGDALLLPADIAERPAVAVVEGALVAPATLQPGGGWHLGAAFAPRPQPGAAAPAQIPARTDPMTDPIPDAMADAAQPGSAQPGSASPAGTLPDPAADEPAREGDGQLAALDALELRLSFRVGEALMPLSDLRRAGPGTVVTLDRPDGAPVDIVVNGQVVGTGQIVTVAGQKACEIRTLFGDG